MFVHMCVCVCARMCICVRICACGCAVVRLYLRARVSMHVTLASIIESTMRVPVQRAVERDEIPYPYKVHDTTLRPLLNITRKSTIVVRSQPFEVVRRWRHLRDNSRIKIACKHCNCGDAKFFLI